MSKSAFSGIVTLTATLPSSSNTVNVYDGDVRNTYVVIDDQFDFDKDIDWETRNGLIVLQTSDGTDFGTSKTITIHLGIPE